MTGGHLSARNPLIVSKLLKVAEKCEDAVNLERILAELAGFGEMRATSHQSWDPVPRINPTPVYYLPIETTQPQLLD